MPKARQKTKTNNSNGQGKKQRAHPGESPKRYTMGDEAQQKHARKKDEKDNKRRTGKRGGPVVRDARTYAFVFKAAQIFFAPLRVRRPFALARHS